MLDFRIASFVGRSDCNSNINNLYQRSVERVTDDLIDESRVIREGYFYLKPVREKWAEHLSGHGNWESHLWNILIFHEWLEEQ